MLLPQDIYTLSLLSAVIIIEGENMESQGFGITVRDGNLFFADEVFMSSQPGKFFLDFKGFSPRSDVPKQVRNMVEHDVVRLDPYLAKNLWEKFGNLIKDYEKKFGKIKRPREYEIAEKPAKKGKAPDDEKLKMDYVG
jgi:hypothetical protein